MKSIVSVLAILFVVGCGGDVRAPDAGAQLDSSGEIDAGAPADDGDRDGVIATQDCDDADPMIGRSHTERCDNECGAGTEECRDGAWEECSAPTDCMCSAGETRTVACGMCGTQPQRCGSDGLFEDDGTCLYEGACRPGAIEDDMSLCGHRRRLCGTDCEWREWEVIVPQGECVPGTRVTCVGGGTAPCSDRCRAMCTPV